MANVSESAPDVYDVTIKEWDLVEKQNLDFWQRWQHQRTPECPELGHLMAVSTGEQALTDQEQRHLVSGCPCCDIFRGLVLPGNVDETPYLQAL